MNGQARTGQASLFFFARHELRLAWRDALAMLQGGSRRHRRWALIAVLAISLVLHLVALVVVGPAMENLIHPDKASLLLVTAAACLAWSLMLSQTLESATRSFYARSDLDLILSSPASARSLFAIRIGAIAIAATGMAGLVMGPFIDVAALLGGARFLCAYAVLVAMAAAATALAVAATALLFKLAGPKRTRLLAQILAAIVGAGFVIGIQAAAILSYGSLSRLRLLQSPEWIAAAPDLGSPFWGPARAATGDASALCVVLVVALGLFALAATRLAGVFARNAMVVAGSDGAARAQRLTAPRKFRCFSRAKTLRRKEWMLLWRDPWLLSQSLMQVLYLIPPALLLWRNFGSEAGLLVLVPVIVMAAGQLAGGLAWIAISAEDAPDLVATAPLAEGAVLRAKIEAVMGAVALPVLPLALAMAPASPAAALVTLIGAGCAAAAACAVQFFFKAQARRANFRRRQTSSRLATLAEAFASISIAAAAALAAAGLALALLPAMIAAATLASARLLTKPAPRRQLA